MWSSGDLHLCYLYLSCEMTTQDRSKQWCARNGLSWDICHMKKKKAWWTPSLPQTNRANPVQCCSTHLEKCLEIYVFMKKWPVMVCLLCRHFTRQISQNRYVSCEMTGVWHDSCVTWPTCDMTHVCSDSFTYGTWLLICCDRREAGEHGFLISVFWHDGCVTWLVCDMTHVWHDSCVVWLIHLWDMTLLLLWQTWSWGT